jgi:hypothetical protein
MTETELDGMLSEIGGSCTYDNMIKCFEAKMAGGSNDPDELVLQAIKCHDDESESQGGN